jgi:hypothetical protein
MPYTEAQQKEYVSIYGRLAALRASNDAACGSRRSAEIAGVTVTAVRVSRTYIAFEAEAFRGSYAMDITEAADYLATRPEPTTL